MNKVQTPNVQAKRYQNAVYMGILTGAMLGGSTFCDFNSILTQKSLSSYCVDRSENKTRTIKPLVLFFTAFLCFKGHEQMKFLAVFGVMYLATLEFIFFLS